MTDRLASERTDRFRCEIHFRNCWGRCPECDHAEIERLARENEKLRGALADKGMLRKALEPKP